MRTFRFIGILCLASLSGSAFTQVQILAWDVNGSNTNTSLSATSVATNLDTDSGLNALSRNGVSYASASNAFNSSNWNITPSLDMSSANNISFTVSPSAGYELTVNNLQFAMWGSNTAPKNGVWAYRIDSGAFTQFGTYIVPTSSSALTTLNFGSPVTISASQSITLAFFAYGSGSGESVNGGTPATGGTVRIGNITGADLVLNGSVTAIPEPSTYAAIFGALALAGVVVHRRRKHAAKA